MYFFLAFLVYTSAIIADAKIGANIDALKH